MQVPREMLTCVRTRSALLIPYVGREIFGVKFFSAVTLAAKIKHVKIFYTFNACLFFATWRKLNA